MEQYLAVKARYRDAILFFRMGDFYEMFYDDAKIASEVLGLALTSRGHGKAGEVPLAGFPHHALESYLAKMIKAGYRVAICEQLEDPALAKTVVKRDVVQVVTPGTALSDDLLETKRNNFLAAISLKGDLCGLAFADVSTGEFAAGECRRDEWKEQLSAIGPSELLVSEEEYEFIVGQLGVRGGLTITKRDPWIFARDYGYEILTEHFGTVSLKGFGCDDLTAGIAAAGAVLHYLRENQRTELGHIVRLSRYTQSGYLLLDSTTRRNLELTAPLWPNGNRATLLLILDRTLTPMGGRMLLQWIQRPLVIESEIRQRLDSVEELMTQKTLRDAIRKQLRPMGDLERLLSRVTLARANARDLVALRNSLKIIPTLRQLLKNVEAARLVEIREELQELDEVVGLIERAIVEDPPLALTEGGLIRKGYNAELDELHQIAHSGKDWIARLQTVERDRTGIPSLKVNYNKVFGYYLEVTKPHLSKVPAHYIRKQTLVHAERFVTPELKEYEERVLGAEEKMAALEYQLFDEVRRQTAGHGKAIQKNAHLIAQLDCLASLAEVAAENHYCKPEITAEDAILIEDGRHPVVEKLLPRGEAFVPNDTRIDNAGEQILIITGPNMSGKSTYLRQVGLIVLMAQMGSFVPAKRARIGLVDKIFTRVGASDNLAGGESTFLMEMNETANILNNATPRSLILLDEIGRGTSTFDGLSIAWAVAEYLHNNPRVAAKTLFATHYHEMTELALILPRVKNYNVAVREWGDHVVFLRKIVEGGCDHSYGIQVAQLAGLPKGVIERAKEVLANLEAEALTPNAIPKLALTRNGRGRAPRSDQLDLFTRQEHALREEIKKLDLDQMTPLMALNKLDELKKMIDGEG